MTLAREADFLGSEAQVWVERLTPERDAFIEAVRFLTGNGREETAAELAA